MGQRDKIRLTRRQAVAAVGGAGIAGLAGCVGDSDADEIEEGSVDFWKQELNDHAEQADIDWQQFENDNITLRFGMGLHKYSETLFEVKDAFTELTGIDVEFDFWEEDRFWREARRTMQQEEDPFDGFMVGLWPAGGYHFNNWVRDLEPFLDKEEEDLSDKQWFGWPDDYRDDTIELMTFPDDEGGESLVGIANGIEAYGCVGYDVNTYDTLDLDEPETFADLEENARIITESDEVDQRGMVSRTASATLSSANWATMFQSHDAEWIDREALLDLREDGHDDSQIATEYTEQIATLNSDNGVESLERFGSILHNYGPDPNPHTRDWYANNDTYRRGDVAMIYSTPQTSGIIDEERMAETKWLPPLQTEDGRDVVVDTWIWATGIGRFSENPDATWLFIQWANSRAANFMLSTKQWEHDSPRAGHARFEWIWDQDMYEYPEIPGEGYQEAFEVGMAGVPSPPENPPPVPVDTPQNMNIMNEAASAMSNVVRNGPDTAQAELDAVVADVADFATRVPSRYIDYVR